MIRWFGKKMFRYHLDRYVTFMCAAYVAFWQGDVQEQREFDLDARLERRRMEFWARVGGVEPKI